MAFSWSAGSEVTSYTFLNTVELTVPGWTTTRLTPCGYLIVRESSEVWYSYIFIYTLETRTPLNEWRQLELCLVIIRLEEEKVTLNDNSL